MWFPRFLHILIALAILAINEGHGSWSPPPETSRDLAESLAWQDRCLDPARFYDLGARHLENDHGVVLSYDPLSGRFLSPDPLGHSSSLSLYDYANGDPVNHVDPDGRMASTYGRGEGPSRALGSIGSGLSSLAGSMQPGVVRHAFAYAAGASLTASDFSSPSYMRRGMVSGVMGFSGELNRYTQDRMDQGYSEFSARLGAVSYGVTMPLVGVHEAGTGTDFITGKAVDRSLSENLLKVNGGFLFAAGPYASSARLAASSAPAPPRVTAGGPAFEGALYSPQKLQQLTGYLERRGVQVMETGGNPAFIARADGTGTMLLPRNPTALQVKHELSHYLDFRNMGFDAYSGLGRAGREMSVLERLQGNRVWGQMNSAEQKFSID